MNIGYSYWGFLADVKLNEQLEPLSTPDGNAFYSWSIIKALQQAGHKVISIMPNRDQPAVSSMGMNAFLSWAMHDRFEAYFWMSKIDYANVNWHTITEDEMFAIFDECHFDKILHEWRMPIANRNTLDCRDNDDWQPDLFIQNCIIEYCKLHPNIQLIVFDLDYKLTDDAIKNLPPKTKILELGDKWKNYLNARSVYIPFDFSHIHEFGIKPVNERSTSLVYIGNRYERDWCIDKYIPTNLEGVVVHGNWNESGRDSSKRWPEINFAKRLQTSEMHDAYSDAACTILLAKEDYCKYHFMTARIIEAIFYGTIPLFIEEYGLDTIEEFAGEYAELLIVHDEIDVIRRIEYFNTYPDGFAAFVMPRSGLAAKGIVCELAPIDSGYTGEIHAQLSNVSNRCYEIHEGDRVGQLVIVPIVLADFVTEDFEERGNTGFGASGK